ncbi:hypothetical protein AVEN_232324-1 [Araneus ventricosus]|uniref:Uncharacterized protein n=1 Tax=Araneus ventricosus TaxID=182803 RepID=A0A4Y2HJA8_ARAVE|nr:hypothetical protein AVEN_232324-1 [Araneus ventricosus]
MSADMQGSADALQHITALWHFNPSLVFWPFCKPLVAVSGEELPICECVRLPLSLDDSPHPPPSFQVVGINLVDLLTGGEKKFPDLFYCVF